MSPAHTHPKRRWHVAIDTGGTFTDAVARDPSGAFSRVKVLSSAALRGRVTERDAPDRITVEVPGLTPMDGLLQGFAVRSPGGEDLAIVQGHEQAMSLHLDQACALDEGDPIELQAPFDAPRLALHLLLGRGKDDQFGDVAVRVATTRGTNALLEHNGTPFGLVMDQGLEDLLRIGDQSREDIFALDIHREHLQPVMVMGIGGRLDASGVPTEAFDEKALDAIATRIKDEGITAIGISLLHGWRTPEREEELAAALESRGIPGIIRATELSTAQGLLPRTETLAVEVTLREILDAFVAEILPDGPAAPDSLSVMTSSGGLAPARHFRAKDGLLSGPAGGVVGAANAGSVAGIKRILGFDMGGTSTDVSRYDHEFIYRFETRVGPARIQAPCVAIESVAAGGGSICHVNDDGLAVGPRSAGAHPGPACYGAGGPLTITDVNLLLGRGDPHRFGIPIDLTHAEHALDALRSELQAKGHDDPGRDAVLEGLLDIANECMAEAMRAISIREGADPSQHTLVPFGGAGGQHACAIAERLDITRILVPPNSGVLSAVGVLDACEERFAETTVLEELDAIADDLDDRVRALEEESLSQLSSGDGRISRRILALRLSGQDSVIQVEHQHGRNPEDRFRAAFKELYGYPPPVRRIEVAWIRVVAADQVDAATRSIDARQGESDETPTSTRPMRTSHGEVAATVVDRSALEPDAVHTGPCIVHEDGATTIIDEGWSVRCTDTEGLLIEPVSGPSAAHRGFKGADGAAAAELVAARLESIAKGMGELLQRTALSVNVKQRLDFSCAVLDDDGMLLVNAPHMPIHLGSMGICVRRTIETIDPEPGDIILTNHPACGGSHLPDLTTIAPLHERTDGGRLLGFVAVRAHHAEIGGTRPGSTPPFASTLAEEGVLVPPMKIIRGGTAALDAFDEAIRTAHWPSRRPEENLADLQAQVAATRHGVIRIRELADDIGVERYLQLARRVHGNAASASRDALARLGTFHGTVTQRLDDGAEIRLEASCDGERLRLDFTGSSGTHPGNFNAPIAITTGAVVYLMRLLADRAVPMNEGLLEPVDLVVPPGMLDPSFTGDPESDPAVCAGNTETSQRIVDTLLRPFELAACSQGTMNNFLFGTDRFGYYETIAGGSGATSRQPGCSGVHTHMTNTRITDPEILEERYPVRLRQFALRRGSGGTGRHPGGDGLVRSIQALESIDISLVSQHRHEEPYGLAGGLPGQRGRAAITRVDGSTVQLGASAEDTLAPGDTITIETPGGGGWGTA